MSCAASDGEPKVTMSKMVFYFFTTAALSVALALVAYGWYVVRRSRVVGQAATMFAGIATVALALHLVFRWTAAAHAPWSNQFEFATAFATAIMVGNVWAERAYRDRRINLFIVPIALALLAYAATLPSTVKDPGPVIPALQNNLLLTIHVSSAVAAYGVFAIAFAGAVIFLVQGGPRNRMAWLPEAAVAEDLAHRAVMVVVPLHALVLTLGAWWASIAWSRPWAWDPKETSALVTFLIYVLYLHARNQRGWRGTPAALVLIVGFGATLFTFFGNYFLGGLHTYSGL